MGIDEDMEQGEWGLSRVQGSAFLRRLGRSSITPPPPPVVLEGAGDLVNRL